VKAVEHDAGSTSFALRVVAAADCPVTVAVFDAMSQTPIAGAKVVMHPYRTVTDSEGIATLALPKGAYRLLVSAKDHEPESRMVELTTDRSERLELSPEPPQQTDWSQPVRP
jgi:hypothetical protein